MASLNPFPLFHSKSSTNSLSLSLVYCRDITEWNYSSVGIIQDFPSLTDDDRHFRDIKLILTRWILSARLSQVR